MQRQVMEKSHISSDAKIRKVRRYPFRENIYCVLEADVCHGMQGPYHKLSIPNCKLYL